MLNTERKRYVNEGYYYGLLKLCAFLPMDEANSLYGQFPVGTSMIARSRAEELANAMRTSESRRQHPDSLVFTRQQHRPSSRPSSIVKASKKRVRTRRGCRGRGPGQYTNISRKRKVKVKVEEDCEP